MKLHLGCGNDYKEGWINCDISESVKTDMIIELEEKLPFEDNSVSLIEINHTLEHINNFVGLMHEFHRICKSDSFILILVPFYSAWGQYNDPTHVRFFTPFTFGYFSKGNYSHEVGSDKDMFVVEEVKLNFGVGASSKLNFLFDPLLNLNHRFYCRFFAYIFPASQISFILRVVK